MRTSRYVFLRTALLLALLALAPAPAVVQERQTVDRFLLSDVMIPMRDGVRLHAKIFTPKTQTQPLPIIMNRTPYGVDGAAASFVAYLQALADEGYIFVFQDIRGKYGSEGTFVMQRPARAPGDTSAIDEGTDTYDTIDWLLKNIARNNGRVGMLGISYDGWTTVMGALEPHPALKAISPQASPADMWLGDDFHHNGAFRLSYGFEYAAMMESGKDVQQFAFDRYDTFDWLLVQLAHAELHVPQGASRDGAGAEYLVPDHRSEPADIRAEHFRGEGYRFSSGDASHLPFGAAPVARGDPGSREAEAMSSKTFKTRIVREGSMCFIPLNFDPKAVFGKVRAPVKVTVNGYTYRSTIAAMGGPPCIPLRKSNRERPAPVASARRSGKSC